MICQIFIRFTIIYIEYRVNNNIRNKRRWLKTQINVKFWQWKYVFSRQNFVNFNFWKRVHEEVQLLIRVNFSQYWSHNESKQDFWFLSWYEICAIQYCRKVCDSLMIVFRNENLNRIWRVSNSIEIASIFTTRFLCQFIFLEQWIQIRFMNSLKTFELCFDQNVIQIDALFDIIMITR